jgi:hypothetical protein
MDEADADAEAELLLEGFSKDFNKESKEIV